MSPDPESSSKPPIKALTDSDLMPFGKYKTRVLEKVPASYLLHLWDKEDGIWQEPDSPLKLYIQNNWNILLDAADDFDAKHPYRK